MKPLTLKDIEKAMKVWEENIRQPELEKIVSYTSKMIKLGLQHSILDDVDGVVKYGGYRVFYLTKGEFAMSKDYQ